MLLTLWHSTRSWIYRIGNRKRQAYHCPICNYKGPFRDLAASTGFRADAICPRCGALERHRLQSLVLDELFFGQDCRQLRMLHLAPERFFRDRFRKAFDLYVTADIAMEQVDCRVDICALPYRSASFDLVFASHVLEHIKDDDAAIAEIRRVLRSNGIAILPVPIVAEETIEYPAPNPHETMHVRAPGPDYFERYKKHFENIHFRKSSSYPPIHQTHVHGDMTQFPTPESPLRRPMQGTRHEDIVPICYV